MARFKHIDTSLRFLAVDLERQLVPESFEHALHHLIEHELDLSHFDARYCKDESGAPACPPAMLLKIVLFAYSRRLVSSHLIAQACPERVSFIALSGRRWR
jgi:transposase